MNRNEILCCYAAAMLVGIPAPKGTDIAAVSGIDRSKVTRHAATLVCCGLLSRSPGGKCDPRARYTITRAGLRAAVALGVS